MDIQVYAVSFTADPSLVNFVKRKLQKMDTFYDRITNGEVFLKLDKADSNKFQKKYIEVKLNVPGSTIFVKESGTTFEEATDIAMDVLSRQIKRHKQKVKGSKHTATDSMTVVDPGLEEAPEIEAEE